MRSTSDLTLVQVRRRADFVPPGARDAPSLASIFVVERLPLTGPRLPADLAELARAWGRLATASAQGDDVLTDVLLVLVSSVPSALAEGIPPPRLDAPAPVRRPTAAHPRAFRGTKYKPPKAGAPSKADLRPLLAAPEATRALLTALWPKAPPSFRRLRRLGLPSDGLARLAQRKSPPPDVYVAFHHADAPPRAALPPEFVERLLPSLSGAPWELVRRTAALHQRLGLATEDRVSLLAAQLLRVSPPNGLGWIAALESQPRGRWLPFLELALASGAVQAGVVLPRALSAALGRAPEAAHERWAYATFDGLRRAVNPRYLEAGLHYAEQYAPEATFRRVWDAPEFDDDTARRLEQLLPADWAGHELMDLWETCSALPGFVGYVRDNDWRRFTPTQRKFLLRFFARMRWDQDGPFDAQRWRAIAAHVPRLEARAREIPEAYVDQYLNDLGEVLSGMSKPAEIRDRLPLSVDLLARVNRPPFDTDGNSARALGNLLKLPPSLRERLLAETDAPFLALDKACRRANAAALITWGISSLVDGMPGLVADAFGSAPGSLLRTARHLGVLSWAARAQLVGRCSKLPVFRPGFGACDFREMVAAILDTGVPEAAAIVPRALRDHTDGRRTLSSAQVARHMSKIRSALPVCQLAVVRAEVDSQLSRAVGARDVDKETLSALALLQDAEGNRRGLRRFLRALLDGDEDHLRRHPATRSWARRHPKVDLELWTRGFERRLEIAAGRKIVLRLEQDPFEVLKMGTYVGSCLGLGGGLAYSAAAVLLDVNKQVLYARDDRGSVIARQLLAISDDDRLVPFAVYPQSTPPALERAFQRYGAELAGALGLVRHEPGQPYVIEYVLSYEWWDDGAWEPRDARSAKA